MNPLFSSAAANGSHGIIHGWLNFFGRTAGVLSKKASKKIKKNQEEEEAEEEVVTEEGKQKKKSNKEREGSNRKGGAFHAPVSISGGKEQPRGGFSS